MSPNILQTYLSLWEAQVDSQLRFPSDGYVSVKMKLFFQLQPLVVCVHYPVFLLRSRFTCVGDRSTNEWLWVFVDAGVSVSGRVVELEAGCMPRPALSAHGIFISRVWNLHLLALSIRKLAVWCGFDGNCSTVRSSLTSLEIKKSRRNPPPTGGGSLL